MAVTDIENLAGEIISGVAGQIATAMNRLTFRYSNAHRIPAGVRTIIDGESKRPNYLGYCPIKQSLGGSFVYYEQSNTLTGHGTSFIEIERQAGLTISSKNLYPKTQYHSDKVPSKYDILTMYDLPRNYDSGKGQFSKIQFSDVVADSVNESYSSSVFDNMRLKQYILFFGNYDSTYPITGMPAGDDYEYYFSTLKLKYLSLFHNISAKNENFTYFYPLFNYNPEAFALDDVYYSYEFNKTKNLTFPGFGPGAGSFNEIVTVYDNTIDNNENEFLDQVIANNVTVAGSPQYQRELSAIAYQTLIGGTQYYNYTQDASGKMVTQNLQYETLPSGIQHNLYFNHDYSLRPAVSSEALAVAGALNTQNAALNGPNTLFADCIPVYNGNRSVPDYDEYVSQIPEIRIPNIYVDLQKGETYFFNTSTKDLLDNMAGDHPEIIDDPGKTSQGTNSIFQNLASSFKYCNETVESVYQQDKYKKLKNIVYDPTNTSFNESVQLMKDYYPAYIEVEFDNHKPKSAAAGSFFDLFNKNRIIWDLMAHLLSFYDGPASEYACASILNFPQENEEELTKKIEELIYSMASPTLSYNIASVTEEDSVYSLVDEIGNSTGTTTNLFNVNRYIENQQIANINLENFINEILASFDQEGFWPKNLIKFENFDQFTSYVGGNYSNIHMSSGFDSEEAYWISHAYAESKHRPPGRWLNTFIELIQKKMRTMESILSSGRASSEVLFYKIEKTDSNGDLVQNIYIPRPDPEKPEFSKIRYVDTQVKYGKAYNYQIFAYTAIVGTKYRYVFSNTEEANALALQVGYGKQRKEDIIYSAIYDPASGMFLGDAYNSIFTGEVENDKLITIGTSKIVQSPLKQSEITGTGIVGSLEIARYTSQASKDAALAGEKNYENIGYVASVEANTPAGMKDENGEIIATAEDDPYNVGVLPTSADKSGTGDAYEAVVAEKTDVSDNVFISNYRLYTRTEVLESEDGPPAIIPAGFAPSGDTSPASSAPGGNVGQSAIGYTGTTVGQQGAGQDTGAALLGLDEPGIVCENEIEHIPQIHGDVPYESEKLGIVKAYMYPTFHLKKVPYYTEVGVKILDFPPLPPNVNFDPYYNVKNVLLITLENQTGDMQDIPVNILPNDSSVFNQIRMTQKKHIKLPNGNLVYPKLRFKSDDFPAAYQVFRIRGQKPQSYADFGNALYQTLNTSIRTALNDTLENNVKYYYIFRAIDPNGHISNPSPVYEVEMVENSGVSYPIINTVSLGMKTKESETRSFNRYIKIDAAYLQKVVNEVESGINDSGVNTGMTPILGVQTSNDLDETVWNQKKFKFRIKSKNTCRAIDFNVKFKTEHDEVANLIEPCND